MKIFINICNFFECKILIFKLNKIIKICKLEVFILIESFFGIVCILFIIRNLFEKENVCMI